MMDRTETIKSIIHFLVACSFVVGTIVLIYIGQSNDIIISRIIGYANSVIIFLYIFTLCASWLGKK